MKEALPRSSTNKQAWSHPADIFARGGVHDDCSLML